MIQGDALVGAIWKAQSDKGRALTPQEMGKILKCPTMSVRLRLAKLMEEYPYPIQTFMMMKQDKRGTWKFDELHYYVTRREVFPAVVSGAKK